MGTIATELIQAQERVNGSPDVQDEKVPRPGNQKIPNNGKQAIAGESSMVRKLPTTHSLTREGSSFPAWFCSFSHWWCEE